MSDQEWGGGSGGGGEGGAGFVSGSGGVRGPRVATVNVASQFADYLMRAQELGVAFGEDGTMALQPDVLEALKAFHEVLAGGRIKVEVVQRGHPDVVRELNRRAADAQSEANAINKAAGFYMCMAA